jgi:hypothetical protein
MSTCNNSATLASSRNESGTREEGTKAVLASSSIRFLPRVAFYLKSLSIRPSDASHRLSKQKKLIFPLHLFRRFAISVRPISHSIPFFSPKRVRHKTRTPPVLLFPRSAWRRRGTQIWAKGFVVDS